MQPVRKRFDADSAFPFSFVYKDTKNPQNELPDHLHDWYELVYVYSGRGTFFIDRTFYDMREGDLFAIPGNTIHRAFPDKDAPVTSTAVFFSPVLIQDMSLGEPFSYLQCFEQTGTGRNYRFQLAASHQETLEAQIESIRDELRDRSGGYRHAVTLSLHRMLLQLSRGAGPAESVRSADSLIGAVWMTEILPYIDDHLQDHLGLSTLARKAAISPAHFSRVFKQMTGMNVTEFVVTKRIYKAKELLLKSGRDIGGIAEACGFESLPHFHRMFKRVTGITPAAYRRSEKPVRFA